MKNNITYPMVQDGLRHHTGVVIPVYIPAGFRAAEAAAHIHDTTASYCACIGDPRHVCLSVDGRGAGDREAARIAAEFGARLVVCPVNRGKFQGAMMGVRALLENQELTCLAVVDQDGDHFANELPNFIRTALFMRQSTGNDRLLVLGRRNSRHRPMGWLRGEAEELADRMMLDALAYHAVTGNTPLNLQFAAALDEFPDFHSGYKVFSRASAEDVFLRDPDLAGCSENACYRHGVEAVMTVEALLHGAVLGVLTRSTYNEQPISTFGLMNRTQLLADMIIWPCKRLDIPAAFMRQWMVNHISRLDLNTLVPQGREELDRVRQLVLQAWGDAADDLAPVSGPLFV